MRDALCAVRDGLGRQELLEAVGVSVPAASRAGALVMRSSRRRGHDPRATETYDDTDAEDVADATGDGGDDVGAGQGERDGEAGSGAVCGGVRASTAGARVDRGGSGDRVDGVPVR